jgi:DNA-directed RNA polymerase specialized sigma24 family protein
MPDTPDPVDLARLERAIANLPHLQREIFLAHRVDGLSYSQIACWKNLTRRMVQKLMVRALVNIDRQLEGHELRWWQRIW